MGQPYNLRQGWQSENLARYLLSKIAFVSQPITISDDTGTDFFCTLFEKDEKTNLLLPKNSFAIQIKSNENNNEFNITDKESYIRKLEIPFFWGIIDKQNLNIKLYSGEYFESFIAHKGGIPKGKQLLIRLVAERDEKNPYETSDDKTNWYVKFPLIIEINANFDYFSSAKQIKPLSETCELMLKNIAARIKGINLFDTHNNMVRVYFGPYSERMFRENFYKSLTETFYNLARLHKKGEDVKKEYELYKNLFLGLFKLRINLPIYLISAFNESETTFSSNLFVKMK
ncbi:MAG: hypothetical protein WC852_03250 [Candidatus Nanoarchaeia archaeon]|jgi:hypothetical protein